MLHPDCEICKAILAHQQDGKPLNERFEWLCGMVVYDVDAARKIVKDGREVYEVQTEKLAGFVSYTGIPNTFNALASYVNENHIDHVPDSKDDPVILAYSHKPRTGDDWKRHYQPIDGSHRISRAIKYKHPVIYVVCLTEEETDGLLTDRRPPQRRRKSKTK